MDILAKRVDNLARKWTIWQRIRSGTEIATFRVKTFKSDLLKQADYYRAATTPTDRKQRKIV
jgi:hypothetical protein